MAMSLDQPENQYKIEHLHQHVYTTRENLVKVGLVVSEISLLQAIVNKYSVAQLSQKDRATP